MFICLSYVIKLLINLSGIFDYLSIVLRRTVRLFFYFILGITFNEQNKSRLTYFIELFKNWCKGSAGRTPVSWEVEGDDLLVGQGVLGLDLGAVKSKKFGAAKKLHDSIEGDWSGLKWILWKFETRIKLISTVYETGLLWAKLYLITITVW